MWDYYPHFPTRENKFYLYSSIVPSEALYLGHLIPFVFTKYLQDAFNVPLVIQLADDVKFMSGNVSIEESQRLARENAKDIIAGGFDISKTFIFSDIDYVGGAFYKNMVNFGNCLTYNEKYKEGRKLTGKVKKRLIEVLTDIVERHHKARAAVTDEASKLLYFGLVIISYRLAV
ncbi:hypothetical protein AgCh_014619 [Apium graveolens]